MLQYFAQFIEKETGIVYSETTYYQLQSRLEAISEQLGYKQVGDFWMKCLAEGIKDEARRLLLDVATNNETSFFRDPGVFKSVSEVILPAWQKQNRSVFRIWSAAGSTGQEAYSLAMLMEESLRSVRAFSYEITVSDISERVLARAKAGRYSQLEIDRGLSTDRQERFFRRQTEANGDSTWEVTAELKQNLRFIHLNLIDNWPSLLGPFDLVLCRNVLIYQTVEQKKKVVSKIEERLAPGGCLILGGAESLIGLSSTFEQVQTDNSVFYRPKASSEKRAG